MFKVHTRPRHRPTSRADEIAEYGRQYQSERYGMGQRRQEAVRTLLAGLPRGSLLDVSTGRGETLRFADDLGFKPVCGTEVVEALLTERVTYAEAHALPFADGAFDHVTCFDVLEHLVPEDVAPALRELRRVARLTVTASASERPSVFGGRDLHISKRPAAKWEALMRECWPDGDVIRTIDAGGSPCWQWRAQ